MLVVHIGAIVTGAVSLLLLLLLLWLVAAGGSGRRGTHHLRGGSIALVAGGAAAVALMLHGVALVHGEDEAAAAAVVLTGYFFLVFVGTSLVSATLFLLPRLAQTAASAASISAASLLALVFFALVFFWEAATALGMVAPLDALVVVGAALRLWRLPGTRARLAAATLYLTALLLALQPLFCLSRTTLGQPLWIWLVALSIHTLNLAALTRLAQEN